ncbi:hypothetical protein [Plastoroseomonas arctica]|uniref:Uncharacterized protein n=1 Tax=Plastoroseomonas arctica TaxID=1509237 RepID=A0AAF1JZ85_9PROT|nr:hypothetical protein [Plastoroseomonas arctica]MBR0655583.1 hypothetical protein [Plastoroseomonas arctica]
MGTLHLFAALTLFMIAVVTLRDQLPRRTSIGTRQAEFIGALVGLAVALPYLLVFS